MRIMPTPAETSHESVPICAAGCASAGDANAPIASAAARETGSFRRFERFSMLLVFGSLLLLPIYFLVHPPLAEVAHDFVVPQVPTILGL
jgi:Mn2+/Fe2+ NRAMP family transporter